MFLFIISTSYSTISTLQLPNSNVKKVGISKLSSLLLKLDCWVKINEKKSIFYVHPRAKPKHVLSLEDKPAWLTNGAVALSVRGDTKLPEMFGILKIMWRHQNTYKITQILMTSSKSEKFCRYFDDVTLFWESQVSSRL